MQNALWPCLTSLKKNLVTVANAGVSFSIKGTFTAVHIIHYVLQCTPVPSQMVTFELIASWIFPLLFSPEDSVSDF